MLAKSEEGRRRPMMRSTVTLLVPAVLLLAVLLLADVYRPNMALMASDDANQQSAQGLVIEGDVLQADEEASKPQEGAEDLTVPVEDIVDGADNGSDTGDEDDTYEDLDAPTSREKVIYPDEWMLEAKATMALIDSFPKRYRRRKAFDETFNKIRHGFIVRFEDGQVYASAKMLPGTKETFGDWNDNMRQSGQPPPELWQTLRPLCRHGLIGDPKFNIDFAVSVPDEPVNVISDGGVPAFGWVKTGYHTDLLIPYPYTFQSIYPLDIVLRRGNLKSQDNIDQYCYNESLSVVNTFWDSKIPKAIWRGSTTGVGLFTKDNWRDQSRPKLVRYCVEHDDVCDAALSGIVQADDDAAEEMERELPVGKVFQMTADQQGRFKYAIMMDGNSAPSSRMVTSLGQTSLIIKQSSPFMEFFYHSLRPYVHYLPLPNDIGDDLSHIVQWARDHDEEVKEMVVRANTFRCRWLHEEIVEQYIVDLFDLYAERFRGLRGSIETADMVPIHVNCGLNEY